VGGSCRSVSQAWLEALPSIDAARCGDEYFDTEQRRTTNKAFVLVVVSAIAFAVLH